MNTIAKCSIIIRTRNEERWISSCLEAVFSQDYPNFEVILVDNESTDRTLEKAARYPLAQVARIATYRPGAALNAGIRVSDGEFIVCLSGHCIPTRSTWLGSLAAALEEDEQYAGVYGRQEPMSFSSPADKRDLLLVFGLDRKVQTRDSFFHNANSILRRERWLEVPFDEDVTNIEDRVWGQEMIRRGYRLAYEPEASVYHYHGIHQDGDEQRCRNVVRIIEDLNGSRNQPRLTPDNMQIIALIPQRGADCMIGGRSQLGLTIASAKSCGYVKRVFVSTDNPATADTAREWGAETPFLRPEELSHGHIGTDAVVADALQRLEAMQVYPDLVVYLEPTFPFRPVGLLDVMVERLLATGLDTLIVGKRESGAVWHETSPGQYMRVDSGDVPRQYKENLYVSLKGLALVTHPDCIRAGSLYGMRIGVHPIDEPLASFEVRDALSRDVAGQFLIFFSK